MKKSMILACVIILNTLLTNAQELFNIYKKGVVNLEAVADYGSKNNWQTLFSDFNVIQYGSETGKHKKIVVAPDGSVFMSHKSRHEIWKFDKNGNFLKKFGKKGNAGDQFPSLPDVEGILDGKYLFTSDNQGRIKFFDLEGRFIKMLRLNYMPMQIVPLKNQKIAAVGFTDGKTLVTIKDFNTGKESILMSKKDDTQKGQIQIKLPDGYIMGFSMPYSHSSNWRYQIATSKSGNLIIGYPEDGKIAEYSTDGKKLGEFILNITPLKITEDDINKFYESAKKQTSALETQFRKNKNYSNEDIDNIMDQYKSVLEKFKNKEEYPSHLPYFSKILVDSDGNVILFEFTKEENTNSFKAYAYDNKGVYISSSSFNSAQFELNFTPKTFTINNGFVYALATKNNCSGVNLRLVKFKMIQ